MARVFKPIMQRCKANPITFRHPSENRSTSVSNSCSFIVYLFVLIFSLVFLFSEFENLAIGVLDECYNEDEVLAEMLVEREIPKWGGMCALNLAAAAHGERFLAHPCCQASLNSIWKSRGMPGVPYWKVCCEHHSCYRGWLASLDVISPCIEVLKEVRTTKGGENRN